MDGRVLDAETGETLPYASVITASGSSALTNLDGEFQITASPDEVLTFSYVGYEKLRIKASKLKQTVRMKSLSKVMKEVVVMPVDATDILSRLIRDLKRDFRKHKGDERGYFMRGMLSGLGDTYLIEGLAKASSAVNVRDVAILSGRKGLNETGDASSMGLKFTNVQRVAEVAPVTFMNLYWEKAIKPLVSIRDTRQYYDTSIETLVGSEDERLYKITFRWKMKGRAEWHQQYIGERRHIVGTAYVDAASLHLLRFDGRVENAFQKLDSNRRPTDIRFLLTYDHSQGYTAVSNIAVRGGNEDMDYSLLMFSLQDSTFFRDNEGYVGSNVLSSLESAGYDAALWERYDIVKRTEAEELAAFGMSLSKRKEAALDSLRPMLAGIDEETGPGKFAKRLQAFGERIPQEKVFVHMDNTCYFQGDTIWFTAYTRQTNTDRPSDVSGVLYVELLNHDGYLVERKLVEMRKGRGHGFFALNKTVQYSGFYELRAYTRWQLNWGEHEREHFKAQSYMFRDDKAERAYYRDYDKLYSRVFPVYDKPQAPGDYTRDMTLRVLQREFKNEPEKRRLMLSLFPEGGNLVAGIPCRVAFEAAMSDGEQVVGTLSTADGQVKTINRGRGTFTVVPDPETEREVTLVTADGSSVSARLPKAEPTGVALQLEQGGDGWQALLRKTADLPADSLALTLMHEGQLVHWCRFSELASADGGSLYAIGDSLLSKAGIYQLTVFDTQGRVFADRLFFARKAAQEEPTIRVTGVRERYDNYARVELTVQGKAKNTPVSIAVRDTKGSDLLFDNGNIMTEMLLSSEIKGFVPDPGWFFEKDDAEHRQALDLLMMTQGWRRFRWRDMAVKGAWELTQPNEKTPILTGHVDYNPNRLTFEKNLTSRNGQLEPEERRRDYRHIWAYNKKELTPGMHFHAELFHPISKEGAVCDDPLVGNTFTMPLPKFYDKCILFLSVADTVKWDNKKRKYDWIQTKGTGNEAPLRIQMKTYTGEADFRAYIDWPYPRFVKPFGFYQDHMQGKQEASDFDLPPGLLADPSATLMAGVLVTAKRKSRLKGFDPGYPIFIEDAYDVWNTIEDAGVPFFDYKNHIEEQLVSVYLNNYGAPEWEDGNKNHRIRASSPATLAEYEGNVPLDSIYHPKYLRAATGKDVPKMEELAYLYGIDKDDLRPLVDKIAVYTDYQPRLDGSTRYRGENRPETRIMICPFLDYSVRPVYRDRYYTLPGFALPAEFYSPDYSKQTPPEPTDYRRTLYWNPNLQLDGNGEAKISFYNNAHYTTLEIEAEGQAADGELLWTPPL